MALKTGVHVVLSHNVARTKLYYKNTNEILDELSRENMISSHVKIITCEKITLPWVPEVSLACGGNFRCWPKADTSSALGRSRAGHYKDLTETGNRARKVSGTQGSISKTQFKHRTFHVSNLIPSIK